MFGSGSQSFNVSLSHQHTTEFPLKLDPHIFILFIFSFFLSSFQSCGDILIACPSSTELLHTDAHETSHRLPVKVWVVVLSTCSFRHFILFIVLKPTKLCNKADHIFLLTLIIYFNPFAPESAKVKIDKFSEIAN